MAIASKAELINDAYSQLRISGITVNAGSEDNSLALSRIESMMAEFDSRNICVGYNFEEQPDPSSSSGVNIKFNYMVSTNLAIRLVPDFGKKIADNDSLVMLGKQANQSLSTASAVTAIVNESVYPRRMPRGSGNTFRWNHLRRFSQDAKPAAVSCDTVQTPLNTAKPITETWLDNLGSDEIITSFIIGYSTGLREIVAAAISSDGKSISFTVLSDVPGAQFATIQIITNLSTPYNRDVRVVDFNVLPNNTLST